MNVGYFGKLLELEGVDFLQDVESICVCVWKLRKCKEKRSKGSWNVRGKIGGKEGKWGNKGKIMGIWGK